MADEETVDAAQGDTAADATEEVTAGETTTETKSTEPVAGDIATDDKPAEPVYEIKAPDGVTFDKAQTEEFVALAKEQGIAPEAAQALVEKYAPQVAVASQIVAEREAHTKQVEEWGKAVDKAFKPEDVKAASEALARYVPKDQLDTLAADLERTGMKFHPALVAAWAAVGRRIATDPGASSTTRGAARFDARDLYPNTPNMKP